PPAIAYAEWDNATPDAAVYKVIAWDGAEWVITEYGIAGPRVGYTPGANYIAGMSFPSPCVDDRVAVARNLDGLATVELFTTKAGVTTSRLLARSRTSILARPMFPAGRDDRVIAFDVTSYT